jgi:hypothetical protein
MLITSEISVTMDCLDNIRRAERIVLRLWKFVLTRIEVSVWDIHLCGGKNMCARHTKRQSSLFSGWKRNVLICIIAVGISICIGLLLPVPLGYITPLEDKIRESIRFAPSRYQHDIQGGLTRDILQWLDEIPASYEPEDIRVSVNTTDKTISVMLVYSVKREHFWSKRTFSVDVTEQYGYE